jgi:hypothetical protein
MLSLYVADGVLLFLGPGIGLPQGFDRRSKVEVVMDLREQGQKAYPSFASEKMIDSPLVVPEGEVVALSGLAGTTTVLCNENGKYYIYESDQFGFVNPNESWAFRPELSLLGDSFTQGWCVPDGLSYAERMRSAVPSLVNLGMNGNGPLSELAALREYGGELQPKKVVWFYFEGNDVEDLSVELGSSILRRYLSDPAYSQKLRERGLEIDASMRARLDHLVTEEVAIDLQSILKKWRSETPDTLRLWLKLWHVRRLLGLTDLKRGWPMTRYRHGHPEAEVEEAFRGILRESRDRVSAWGGKLYFVYLPAHRSFGYGILHPWRQRVLSIAADLELPVLDMYEVFASQPDPLALYPFRRDGHYNVEGNALVARETLRFVGG